MATTQTPARSTSCPSDRPWLNTFGPVTFTNGDGRLENGNTVITLAVGDSAPASRFSAPLFISVGLCQLAGYTC